MGKGARRCDVKSELELELETDHATTLIDGSALEFRIHKFARRTIDRTGCTNRLQFRFVPCKLARFVRIGPANCVAVCGRELC